MERDRIPGAYRAEADHDIGTDFRPSPSAAVGGLGEYLPEPWVRDSFGVVLWELVGHVLHERSFESDAGVIDAVALCRISSSPHTRSTKHTHPSTPGINE